MLVRSKSAQQTESTIKNYGTWVCGEHETTASAELREDGTPKLSGAHFTRTIEAKVHASDDGEHAVVIEDRTFTYLGGIWKDPFYQTHQEMHITLTLAQLEMVAETLNTFLAGIKNGEIVSR